MAMEPGFMVCLGIYRIDPEVDTRRREIRDLLASRIEAVLGAYFDNALLRAPFTRRASKGTGRAQSHFYCASIARATDEISAGVQNMHEQTAVSARVTSHAVSHSQHTQHPRAI